jgi:hypothetical protein
VFDSKSFVQIYRFWNQVCIELKEIVVEQCREILR